MDQAPQSVICVRFSGDPPTAEILLKYSDKVERIMGTPADFVDQRFKYNFITTPEHESLQVWLKQPVLKRTLPFTLEAPDVKLIMGDPRLQGRNSEGDSKKLQLGCQLWNLLVKVHARLEAFQQQKKKEGTTEQTHRGRRGSTREKDHNAPLNFHIELTHHRPRGRMSSMPKKVPASEEGRAKIIEALQAELKDEATQEADPTVPHEDPSHQSALMTERALFIHNKEIDLLSHNTWGFLTPNPGSALCLLVDGIPDWPQDKKNPHVTISYMDQSDLIEIHHLIFEEVERFFTNIE